MEAQPAPSTFRRDLSRIAVVGAFGLVAFVSVSLWFAREASERKLKECDDDMAPLVAQGAGPEAVAARLGTTGETFSRDRMPVLLKRVSDFSPGPQSDEKLNDAAARYATSRLYAPPKFIAYVAFFDASEHVRDYLCIPTD